MDSITVLSLSVPVRLSLPLCLRLRCYLYTAIVRCCCFLAARPSPCPACPSVPVILSLSVRSSVVWYLSIRPVWLSVRPDHHFLSSPSIISISLFRVFLCPLSSSHGLVRLPLVVVRPLLRLVSSSHRKCSTSPFGGSSIWLHRLSASCRSSHCPAYLPAPSSSPIVSNAIFISSFVAVLIFVHHYPIWRLSFLLCLYVSSSSSTSSRQCHHALIFIFSFAIRFKPNRPNLTNKTHSKYR